MAEKKIAKKTAEAAKKTVKKTVKKETAAVKKTAKATREKAAATAKKVAEALTPDKTAVYVQYLGQEFAMKEILAKAKEAYIAAGSVAGPVRTLDLYVKPEDFAAYYVVNGDATGSVDL